MKADICPREQAVVAALLAGSLAGELLDHAASCPVCSEVLFVTQSLSDGIAPEAAELRVPDASVVWRRAQRVAREKAVARATLPIRIARNCAYALAILAAPWIAFEFCHPPTWISTAELKHFSRMDGNWLAAFTGTTLLGMAAALVCIALSSWFVLREE